MLKSMAQDGEAYGFNQKFPYVLSETAFQTQKLMAVRGGSMAASIPSSMQAKTAQAVCSLECCQEQEHSDAGGEPGGEIAHRMCW